MKKAMLIVACFFATACAPRVVYQRVTVPPWLTDLPDRPTIDPRDADTVEVGHFIISLDEYAKTLRAKLVTIKTLYGGKDD